MLKVSPVSSFFQADRGADGVIVSASKILLKDASACLNTSSFVAVCMGCMMSMSGIADAPRTFARAIVGGQKQVLQTIALGIFSFSREMKSFKLKEADVPQSPKAIRATSALSLISESCSRVKVSPGVSFLTCKEPAMP